MKVNGENLKTLGAFPSMMTVPDCFVARGNKIGHGHGESKFYIASKKEMYDFYGNKRGFEALCFMLKHDLVAYMDAIKNEYFSPSQEYAGKADMPSLWVQRMAMISELPEVITFKIRDQHQIEGPRGYINSDDDGYQIIREIALPLVSYIYAEKVGTEDQPMFYWKLFVDYDAIWERQNEPLVFSYGKQKGEEKKAKPKKSEIAAEKEIRQARDGQGLYREKLLEQCKFCPFTMITDERLLIASHIKPWASSTPEEKVDPYNGYILSPLYDKLFDRGFITFTPTRHVILSEFIPAYVWSKQIHLSNNQFVANIRIDDKRIEYLKFHHQSVFKGNYEFEE